MRVALAVMLGTLACAAGAADEGKAPPRLAFVPQLIHGAGVPACEALRETYDTAFRAAGEFEPWSALRQAEPGTIEDFDGDGRAERLYRLAVMTRGGHEAYALFALEAAAAEPVWGHEPVADPRIAPALDGELALGMQTGDWTYTLPIVVRAGDA